MCNYHNFSFDHVYGPDSTQEYIYDNTAKAAVLSVLQGYNATILAYDQTGTGKTYTMEGFCNAPMDQQKVREMVRWPKNKGIVPRSMEEIFKFIEETADD